MALIGRKIGSIDNNIEGTIRRCLFMGGGASNPTDIICLEAGPASKRLDYSFESFSIPVASGCVAPFDDDDSEIDDGQKIGKSLLYHEERAKYVYQDDGDGSSESPSSNPEDKPDDEKQDYDSAQYADPVNPTKIPRDATFAARADSEPSEEDEDIHTYVPEPAAGSYRQARNVKDRVLPTIPVPKIRAKKDE